MWDTIIVNPFTNILLLINMLVSNFGVAIILFTILIKLLTWPLNAKQIKSQKAMTDMQNDPHYKKIMEKYKDNKEMLAQEQMRYYKEKGVSPFGSCLPTLLQFPIIIGLYQSIMKAMAASPYELHGLKSIIYPFLDPDKILPLQRHFLWMDLGQPERLNVFGIGIPVLAILVVISQFAMTRLITPAAANDDPANPANAMSKNMNIMMPLMMGMIAYSWSAGLGIYLLISNILSAIQYAVINKTPLKALLAAPVLPGRSNQAAEVSKAKNTRPVETRIIETTSGKEIVNEDDDDEPVNAQTISNTKVKTKIPEGSFGKQKHPQRKR